MTQAKLSSGARVFEKSMPVAWSGVGYKNTTPQVGNQPPGEDQPVVAEFPYSSYHSGQDRSLQNEPRRPKVLYRPEEEMQCSESEPLGEL